jgi:hypothetical protein
MMKAAKIAVAVAAVFASFNSRAGFVLGALALSLNKEERDKLPKDVQPLYVEKEGKFVLDLPEGVEEVGGLKSALEKERAAKKEADKKMKELAERYKDIDPEEYRRIMDKIGDQEEAMLLKAGKFDEVVAKRMDRANAAHKKALEEAAKKVQAAEERAKKFSQQVLDNHVRAAAAKAGVHQHAVEDALIRARSVFMLDAEGNAVQMNGEQVVLGKDGKTPFAPSEWIEGMKEQAPHWFPAGNNGGGAGGDKGGKGGGTTMKRSEFDALDPASKVAKAREANEGKLKIVD